jgi:hypothetical protein
VVVRVSAGHSQLMCSRSVWLAGGVMTGSLGGVKYWLTKFAREKPVVFFCCSYNCTIVAGSAFGVASTKVF